MPKEHVPYEPLMAYMVESFYVAKGIDQANKISKILFAQCEEEFKFYSSLGSNPDAGGAFDSDMGNLQRALQMLQQSAERYGQKDLLINYGPRLKAIGVQTESEARKAQYEQQKQQSQSQFDQKMIDSMMNAAQIESQSPL